MSNVFIAHNGDQICAFGRLPSSALENARCQGHSLTGLATCRATDRLISAIIDRGSSIAWKRLENGTADIVDEPSPLGNVAAENTANTPADKAKPDVGRWLIVLSLKGAALSFVCMILCALVGINLSAMSALFSLSIIGLLIGAVASLFTKQR